ncbi:MmpS family transport accessory protein [Cystobacter fuscus]|uniref:MmpS family transport accessory protein n=1 Tax=Cystobacter fuscus TaxID=43 RepID=UPI002B2C4A2C|nr:hypothetical protein F0U63_09645 [Cystobacter fuscus]
MHSRSFARTVLAVAGVALASCGAPAPEETPPKDCAKETTTYLIPTSVSAPMGYAVKYEVIGSGAGTITKITYLDGSSTPVVVENPTLPWTKTVTVFPKGNVRIGMEGSVTNGRFEMKYNVTLNSTSTPDEGDYVLVSASSVCEQHISSSTSTN